jgi:NAD(P)H-nitrite reductase large subunit
MKNIVIIGNGIAGITAARHIRKKSDHAITVISDETEHFYSRTALMYIYMGHMEYHHTKPYEDWFWPKNNIQLVKDRVEKIDTEAKKLRLRDGKPISYDILVIATGSVPNKFGWPGQDLKGVTGLYGIPDLQTMENYTRDIEKAVIVGGGLIGIEMAEMLHSRKIPVTFLVRENSFWNRVLPAEESAMVNRHILAHGIDLRLETELQSIESDENGRVKAVITKSGETIKCHFVGLTVGVKPNIAFLQDSGIETDKGVLVDEYFATNVHDVYAIGDCAQHRQPRPGRKPVEQIWYTGRMQGETLAYTLCGNKTAYQPGVFYNSAKFFDIEYQVYGQVNTNPDKEEEHLYWEHPDGRKSIRIVYKKDDHRVIGFNLMGIRYRHEVCERWINNKEPIQHVLRQLKKANFDPEFFNQHEAGIIGIYNQKNPQNPVGQKKKALLGLFSY